MDDYAGGYIILKCVLKATRNAKETVGNWFRGSKEDLIRSGSVLIEGIIAEMKQASASSHPSELFANVFMG